MFSIGRSNGGHDFHGFGYSPTNEVPSWGLRYKGKDNDDVEKRGYGRGYVEIAPCLEDVCNAGEKCNAAREEVEGGHPRRATFCWADWFGGENEGAEADPTGAKAGDEAEEGIDPVVRGEGC